MQLVILMDLLKTVGTCHGFTGCARDKGALNWLTCSAGHHEEEKTDIPGVTPAVAGIAGVS